MDREPLPSQTICDEGGLREIYAEPSELARKKQLDRLDKHCRDFIALSPFLTLGTSTAHGADVSPRGDPPGFVQVLDDNTILIPDRPGNNRLDTLGNLMVNPAVGILFLIPGVEETLRVNGTARVTTDPTLLAACVVNGKTPKSALKVEVREAYLHCAKALKRSRLWSDDYKIERKRLPSLGRIITEQVETGMTAEQAEQRIEESYKKTLY